jgi:hypothetical protein
MRVVLVARREVGQLGQASIRWAAAAALLSRATTAVADPAEGVQTATPAGAPSETPAPVVPEQAPSRAPPQTAPERGISVGLRAGYAFPMGLWAKGDDLSANVRGMVPIWVDAGYRLSREFYVGAFGAWGFGSVADQLCPAPLSCSATDWRLGLDAHLHLAGLLRLAVPIDWWVGLGAGYESTTLHIEAQGVQGSETDRGFEFGNLQLGADYTGFGAARVGGFFTLTLAQYSSRSLEDGLGTRDYTPERALHLWLMLGVRGQYDL